MNIIEEKKQLRKLMFKDRKSLDLSFKTEYDKWICSELLNLVKSNNYNSIHVYLPMGEEINIYPFIKKILDMNKIVIAPKTLPNRQLENLVLDDLDKVKKGVFGTTYPGSGSVYNESIDLIVVPGLAVDLDNYRLGYGGGYYDTFMSKYPNANKVGIFYPFQLADKVPTEPHDLRLNQVIIGEN